MSQIMGRIKEKGLFCWVFWAAAEENVLIPIGN